MKASEKLLLAVAVVIALFGLFMILGAIVEIFDPSSKNSVPADLALLVFLGLLPLAFAVWLFMRTRANALRRAEETREQLVLHLASRHQGVLTVPQLAEESGMSLEQAKEILDRLYRKSFTQLSLAESGEAIYTFHL
jgi:ABC-type multidrug transport system fused ATPase/permease subunit